MTMPSLFILVLVKKIQLLKILKLAEIVHLLYMSEDYIRHSLLCIRWHSLFEIPCPEHAMSTTLDSVGLQVWRGSLLMADYLLCQDSRLDGSVVLELGAGTGLVSLIAAQGAQCVFCTGQY